MNRLCKLMIKQFSPLWYSTIVAEEECDRLRKAKEVEEYREESLLEMTSILKTQYKQVKVQLFNIRDYVRKNLSSTGYWVANRVDGENKVNIGRFSRRNNKNEKFNHERYLVSSPKDFDNLLNDLTEENMVETMSAAIELIEETTVCKTNTELNNLHANIKRFTLQKEAIKQNLKIRELISEYRFEEAKALI